MSLNQPLPDTQRVLRAMIVEDLAAALSHLKELLPESAEKQNDLLALMGRLNHSNQKRYRAIIPNEEHEREINMVREGFLDLVKNLEEADFEAVAAPKSRPGPKTGSVLYRIPHRMLLQKSARCVVRVALDEDAIIENITFGDDVQVRNRLVVSNAMDAELLNPPEQNKFLITTPSDTRQLIREVGYTEWLFFATPLYEGTHQLIVKISVLEKVPDLGNDLVRRNVTLEETVEIVAEAPSTYGEQPLKSAGIFFTLPAAADTDKDNTPPPPAPLPPPPPPLAEAGAASASYPFLIGAAIVAALLLLLWLLYDEPKTNGPLPNQYSSESPLPPSEQAAFIFVHAPDDSRAEGLWVSSEKIPLESGRPSIWGAYTAQLPKRDSAWQHIVFQGDVSGRTTWRSPLTEKPTHLYVPLLPRDTPCGVFVQVDTILRPAEGWRLVWEKSPGETEAFAVRPLSDSTFYVPLGTRCAQLYGSPVPWFFYFRNGAYQLSALGLLGKWPATLVFRKPSGRPSSAALYPAEQNLLKFSRPIALTGIRVNGRPVQHLSPYSAEKNPNQQVAASFTLSPDHVSERGYTVQVLSSDCDCDPQTFVNQTIKGTIVCREKPTKPPGPPPVSHTASPVSLSLPPKLNLAQHLQDLEITLDGEHYSSSIQIKNNRIEDLGLKPTKKTRSLCLRFLSGHNSGKVLELGCYTGPIVAGMKLKLVDGEIVVE